MKYLGSRARFQKARCCPGRSCPAFEAQIGDPAEVLRVVRDEGQATSVCRRRDEQVEILDQLTPPTQVRFDVAEGSCDCRIDAQNNDAAGEILDRPPIVFGSSREGSSVKEFCQRHHRDAYRLRAGARETAADRLTAPQPKDARVGVQQVVYSLGGSILDRRAS